MSAELTMFHVPDPENPMRVFVLRGTEDGIKALQAMLKQRFQDGREVGRAEALEPEAAPFVSPEERVETPLPLAG